MTSETDGELLRRTASGEREAFRLVLERHEARVFHFALALLQNEDAAADVTQDAFLVLLRNPGAYDPGRGALGSFLLGIARNLVLKEFRRRKREAAAEVPAEELPGAEAQAGADLERRERALELREAVTGLSPVQQQVLTLRFQQELDLQGIAEVMLLPLNTVKSHLRRAVISLRGKAGEEEGDHGL